MKKLNFIFLLGFIMLGSSVSAQTHIQDIFGRSLDQRGITLVDWDGYMANPLIKFYVLPPANAALPGSVTLSANGTRLYFDNPGKVNAAGPVTTRAVVQSGGRVPVKLAIFPAHSHPDPAFTLSIVFTDANQAKQTNTFPITILDLNTLRPEAYHVTVNFDHDPAQFFTNPVARLLVHQAAGDWAHFFADMNLAPVAVGTEKTWMWSNEWSGGFYFANTNAYTGYQLYAYGTSNSAQRSGGEASYDFHRQVAGGIPLPLHRSGGFEANVGGNYNALGWLFLTNDGDWLATGNLRHETNDFYSIAHHEIGHALIFNQGHPGFAKALAAGAFTSAAVTNYYGRPVPIHSPDDHLPGVIDPESGQGAFGWEYHGEIPRRRWTLTKLDLLCAQEVGYTLRANAAFAPLAFPAANLPDGRKLAPYSQALIATGGIPVYHWEITAGALPRGLTLNEFSGVLSGIPESAGTFRFTLRVTDYHENSTGRAQEFTLQVDSP